MDSGTPGGAKHGEIEADAASVAPMASAKWLDDHADIIASTGLHVASDAEVAALRFDVEREQRRRTARLIVDRATHGDRSPYDGWRPTPGFQEEVEDNLAETGPGVLWRGDGKGLLYQGYTNAVVGRRAAGKTWLAIRACIDVHGDGGTFAYVDMEDRRRKWGERFQHLGFDIIAAVNDGSAAWLPGGAALGEWNVTAAVESLASYQLVVFDVMNRLMTRVGGNPDADNGKVLWLYDHLFDPLAAQGACVLILDHPNRHGQRANATPDDLDPGGGAGKMNSLSGVGYGLKVLKPMTRDNLAGEANLIVLKDRNGHFEEQQVAAVMKSDVAVNELTDTLGLRIDFNPPTAMSGDDSGRLVERCRTEIVRVLGKYGPLAKKDIKNLISSQLRGSHVMDAALTELSILHGEIVGEPGSKWHLTTDHEREALMEDRRKRGDT